MAHRSSSCEIPMIVLDANKMLMVMMMMAHQSFSCELRMRRTGRGSGSPVVFVERMEEGKKKGGDRTQE